MPDQLFDTTRTGQLLGGLHPNDVLRLIHDRRLDAKRQRVRGGGKTSRPRYYIKASEIQRYINELPNADDTPVVKKRADRKPAGLRKELEAATQYV